jgi:Rap1a immunity proteins
VVAGLLWPAAALSQFVTGNSLYEDCTRQTGAGERLYCSGYVTGLVEGMMMNRKQVICPPQGITIGPLVDMVVKHLRDHPETRHYAANSEVGLALMKAFPCKEQAH